MLIGLQEEGPMWAHTHTQFGKPKQEGENRQLWKVASLLEFPSLAKGLRLWTDKTDAHMPKDPLSGVCSDRVTRTPRKGMKCENMERIFRLPQKTQPSNSFPTETQPASKRDAKIYLPNSIQCQSLSLCQSIYLHPSNLSIYPLSIVC